MRVTRRRAMCVLAGAALAACGVVGDSGDGMVRAGPAREDFSAVTYTVSPIGRISNPKGGPVRLEIFEKYVPGLQGLERCSYVTVVWWFHRNDSPAKRSILKVHPRGNAKNPLTGVFATHSPVRPNLIALTTCKVLSVEGGIVTIDKIDAFDDTPIIDLKSAGSRMGKPLLGRGK